MTAFKRVAFVGLVTLIGLFCGTAAGSLFVPPGSGLAGPAVALGYGAVGAVAALTLGVVLAIQLAPRALLRALLVAVLLVIALVVWIGYRVSVVSAETPAAARQRQPQIALRDLPMGLGIAHVTPRPGSESPLS
jgi:hypothetical protein